MRQWFRTAEPLGERRYENWNTHTFDAVTANLVGRMHGAPYCGCGCVPLRFGGGGGGGGGGGRGASLGEWEHNNERCNNSLSNLDFILFIHNEICIPACCLGFLVNRV